MDGTDAEARTQAMVQLFPGKLLAAALHPSGLHDSEPGVIRTFQSIFFRKIQEGESHSQQQGLLPPPPQLRQGAVEAVVVVEIIAALRAAALPYQTVRHIDQGRALTLQISGQQGQNDIILRRPVKMPETG